MSVSKKTGEIYYTDEELQAALQNNNALQYAMSRGYHLVRAGNEYYMTNANNYVSEDQITHNHWKPIKDVPAVIFATAIPLKKANIQIHETSP